MQKSTAIKNQTIQGKTNWDICFDLACKYFAEHGDWNIPVKYVSEDDVQLGMWCHNVRKRYLSGQLAQEKIDRLNAVGFEFKRSKRQSLNPSWNKYYSAARAYYEENGHLSIPMGYETQEGLKLANWVGQQRYAISTGKISAERKARLEEIGIYITRSEKSFETGVCHLKKYLALNGDADVPMGYVCDDGFNLGNWVMLQRKLYKEGKLSDRKKEILAKLNFHKSHSDAIWEDNYKIALDYYNQNGNLDLLFSSDDDRRIGQWLAVQRMKYRRGELSDEQIKLLDEIGIVWNPAEETWARNYGLAKEYYISHGQHVKFSYSVDGYAVGVWLKTQQVAYYDGRLNDMQRKLLEDINAVPAKRTLPVITETLARPVGGAV